MTILIEDSPRNLAAWITEAIRDGLARGAVVTPWATPVNSTQHRRSAAEVANEVTQAGGEIWFDPITHALQMGGVGDFRYYDEYDLWAGSRGDLSTSQNREEHVRKVFALQSSLGARHLAPTVLLHHGETQTSKLALNLAEEAIRQDPQCWLSIAGTEPLWTSDSALDAHIGALAQLGPQGWFVTVARPLSPLPVEAHPEEVFGLCRTVRALSEYSPVHISHGDLAGLPAVAAGAYSIGTGWDQRQRACSFGNFTARGNSEGGGRWYLRPTFEGLFGSLKRPEAELLNRLDAPRAARLGGLPPPGPREAFRAHLESLGSLVTAVITAGGYRDRCLTLMHKYTGAASEWPEVVRQTASELDETDWIADLAAGLALYATSEGWRPRRTSP